MFYLCQGALLGNCTSNYHHIIIFPSMIKTADYTRETKFPKLAFSFPNSTYLCMSSKKNLSFKFRKFPKKYFKEIIIIHIGSVRIYKSLCFLFWILTRLIVKKNSIQMD